MNKNTNPIKSKFDSRAEKLVNSLLPKYINTKDYSISTHVNLERIFKDLELVKNFQKEFERFCDYIKTDIKDIRCDKMHFDFVIYENKYDLPVLLLEVNGATHIENERKKVTDQFKNHIANKNNIPLKTLELYTSHSDEEIENLLKETLTNASLPGLFPTYCKCGQRLIYKCFKDKNKKVQYYQCQVCKKPNGKFLTYNLTDFPPMLALHTETTPPKATHSPENREKLGKLYLEIPYKDNPEVKLLGAKFDGNLKKWYFEGNVSDFIKFSKWILRDTPEVFIASDYIYILEKEQQCPKCHKNSIVISLGIGDHIYIFKDNSGNIIPKSNYYTDDTDLIHLAWTNNEENIPPKILNYLKTNYHVKIMHFSNDTDCFSNYCEHCGTPLKINLSNNKPKEPFSLFINRKTASIKNNMDFTIKLIPIEPNLPLNWDVSFNEADKDFLKQGHKSYINLRKNTSVYSITDDDYITYQELYEL